MLELKDPQQIQALVELHDLTFALGTRGERGSERQIRSTRLHASPEWLGLAGTSRGRLRPAAPPP